MEECVVEKCHVNLTRHWSGEIPTSSLMHYDIFYWTVNAIIILFGIPFNIGIIHYEWYGGDPQKRSLSNRMVTSGIIAQCTAGTTLITLTGIMR